MIEKILVLGSSPAALQAARNLADSGCEVTLAEKGPFFTASNLDEEPFYRRDVSCLEILKHPRITVRTNTEINQLQRLDDKSWQVDFLHTPRFVDLTRCTACGDCLEVCPVTIPGTNQKAVHFGGQPDCAVITKKGISPCTDACPAGIPVQGYVALTAAGRYQEAYQVIQEALPFPSVCGRVCNHNCEESCSRAQYDQPVNIMALKRFVADRIYQEQDRTEIREKLQIAGSCHQVHHNQRVAIIGAGPAGLTAARDLIRAGYPVSVFDANSHPGGMMRVGIPPHRLDYDQLEWEIEQILLEGVELHLNTWVDDIPALLETDFAAVLLATGAHQAVKINIENADHPDNWLSLDFLKKVCLGEPIDLTGRRVIVLGGGDVAMDAARSAIRLGQPEVRILCRGIRASVTEIEEAEEEGIEIIRDRVFKSIILDQQAIAGVECLEAEVGDVIDGKRQFRELPGTEHLIPGDLVIWAVGQRPDFSYLPANNVLINHSDQGIQADQSMMTTLEGVFTAGDVRRGTTFFVVDAVGEGHRAARAIVDYLVGKPSPGPTQKRNRSILDNREIELRLQERKEAARKRSSISSLPVGERINNFLEVEKTFTERTALQESGRCLACGPCSECGACLEVCGPGAILPHQAPRASSQLFKEIVAFGETDSVLGSVEKIPFPENYSQTGSATVFDLIRNSITDQALVSRSDPKMERGHPRTGLVLCQCGGKISHSVDTAGLREEAKKWIEVHQAVEIPFSCTSEGAEQIQSLISEHGLQRVVLAACSCCELDQVCFSCTYQRVRCKENLGAFSEFPEQVEMVFVNIREQCALVHTRSKARATAAARILIRSALGRIPASQGKGQVQPIAGFPVLVVGEGDAAETCLASLQELGLQANAARVLSGRITRSGGHYTTRVDGQELTGDGLVLAPASRAELDYISDAVVLNNHQPLLIGNQSETQLMDLGIAVCALELEADMSGKGAAVQLYAWLAKTAVGRQAAARVDPLRCRNCGTCLEVCGVGVPEIVTDQLGDHARIDPRLCLNCGVCAAHCPSGAILPGTQTDLELERVLDEVLR